MYRVNVGCGSTPTPGWKNYDNSLSVRVARRPVLGIALSRFRLLTAQQRQFIAFCREHDISWADVCTRIPLPDASVEVLYTSHMLEHLDPDDRGGFLREARRVLVPNGLIRIAVPDIRQHASRYLHSGDADSFIAATNLTRKRPRTLWQKLAYVLAGDRHHQWMYDGNSMSKLLQSYGFSDARVLPPGATLIPNAAPLNLREREEESVYVEARAPHSATVPTSVESDHRLDHAVSSLS